MRDSSSETNHIANLLFTSARTHNGWLQKSVSDDILKKAVDLAKWGPTSANCLPMRVLFVRSPEAKQRLVPYLLAGNQAKTLAAPVTAIVAYDLDFPEYLPKLFPATDARSWFIGNDELIFDTAFRNATLQAAYLLIALRMLGLDVGPMSGFEKEGLNKEFFSGTNIRSNFLINIGYGDPQALYPRGARLEFDEIAKIL